ncbi:MAG: BRCT domain-containing protein, partial [Bacteroidota bacterium]
RHGLNLEIDEENKPVSSELENLNFVISGTFNKYSRDEIKSLIEKNGGKNQSSVNSKTDYLIAGENIGPSKKKKAEVFNVKIIDEESFEKMIGPKH